MRQPVEPSGHGRSPWLTSAKASEARHEKAHRAEEVRGPDQPASFLEVQRALRRRKGTEVEQQSSHQLNGGGPPAEPLRGGAEQPSNDRAPGGIGPEAGRRGPALVVGDHAGGGEQDGAAEEGGGDNRRGDRVEEPRQGPQGEADGPTGEQTGHPPTRCSRTAADTLTGGRLVTAEAQAFAMGTRSPLDQAPVGSPEVGPGDEGPGTPGDDDRPVTGHLRQPPTGGLSWAGIGGVGAG